MIPIPGKKDRNTPLNIPITCGGVHVSPDDIIVADEEGIAVIPNSERKGIYAKAKSRAKSDASTPLEEWKEEHYKKIQSLLDIS